MVKRYIHTLHRASRTPTKKPPLLFVHGGYVDARCWGIHFLPYFAACGYDCTALDLSGHGESEGREWLDCLGLNDYLDDVVQIIERFKRKPIVLGHSMGAAVVERVLERSLIDTAVLMAPVPPSGTAGSVMNLALKYPYFFSEITNVTKGRYTEESLPMMRDIYFSPGMESKALMQFSELIQPESQRAISDMLMLGWWFPQVPPEARVLVLGGELDALFPPDMIRFVALRWKADLKIIPDTGHAFMLDRNWKVAAERVVEWLQRLE